MRLVPADAEEIAEIELYREGQLLGTQTGDGSQVYKFEWDKRWQVVARIA